MEFNSNTQEFTGCGMTALGIKKKFPPSDFGQETTLGLTSCKLFVALSFCL